MTISRDDARFWDTRTIERRLRRGQLSTKDLDKHLKALPDVADKAQPFDLDAVDDEDDLDAAAGAIEDEEEPVAPPAMEGEGEDDDDLPDDDDDDDIV